MNSVHEEEEEEEEEEENEMKIVLCSYSHHVSLFVVRFRTIPINTELRAFDDAVDVYMLDPNRHIMRRWLSRQVSSYNVECQSGLTNTRIKSIEVH
jgi:hypothetical protein